MKALELLYENEILISKIIQYTNENDNKKYKL